MVNDSPLTNSPHLSAHLAHPLIVHSSPTCRNPLHAGIANVKFVKTISVDIRGCLYSGTNIRSEKNFILIIKSYGQPVLFLFYSLCVYSL